MIIISDLQKIKGKDLVQLKCSHCGNPFYQQKNYVLRALKGTDGVKRYECCSPECLSKFRGATVDCLCSQCKSPVLKQKSSIKSFNIFCSQSCAATYNNVRKTHGYRRSKLEIWLEQKLKERYSYYKIEFNQKSAIQSELDIFFPDLKLAFELNGIFHYEPIYGEKQFGKIQNNDRRKFAACAEAKISLCIIDTSKQLRFTELSSQKYLDIIVKIIDEIIVANPILGKYETVQNIPEPEILRIKQSDKKSKIIWPDDESLKEILKNESMRSFARKNNISAMCVSSYCKKKGIKTSKWNKSGAS